MNRDAALRNINAHVDHYAEVNQCKKESIAERIGIGRTTFYVKLRGESDFDVFEACALADLVGCTVDQLLDAPPTQETSL